MLEPVKGRDYTASEAARELGISLDTLRRWDREGKIRVGRDRSNRRVVAPAEVERLRGGEPQRLSARNRFHGVVQSVKVDGLLAQVELIADEPAHVVAIVTADSVEQLGLRPGQTATAVIKSTSVMVER
jgi:molybdopterin-binding protein